MSDLEIGDRVLTPHGRGTITGIHAHRDTGITWEVALRRTTLGREYAWCRDDQLTKIPPPT